MAEEYCTCTIHVHADYTISRPGDSHLALAHVICEMFTFSFRCALGSKGETFMYFFVNKYFFPFVSHCELQYKRNAPK